MRISKTLMTGAVAAVAMAGSANAGFIDAFTVGGMGVNPQPGSPFQSREVTSNGSASVNTSNQTLSMSRTAGNGQFLVQWANWSDGVNPGTGLDWTGLQSISFTINSTTGGSIDLTIASMDDSDSTSNRRMRWLNLAIGTGITNVVLNVGSPYTSGTYERQSLFNESAVNFATIRVNGTTAFDASVSNFQYNIVPAPGALALLGTACLVGARRRRA